MSTNNTRSKRKTAPTFNPLATKEARDVKAKCAGKKPNGPGTKRAKDKSDSPPGVVTPDFSGVALPFQCYFLAKGEKEQSTQRSHYLLFASFAAPRSLREEIFSRRARKERGEESSRLADEAKAGPGGVDTPAPVSRRNVRHVFIP